MPCGRCGNRREQTRVSDVLARGHYLISVLRASLLCWSLTRPDGMVFLSVHISEPPERSVDTLSAPVPRNSPLQTCEVVKSECLLFQLACLSQRPSKLKISPEPLEAADRRPRDPLSRRRH